MPPGCTILFANSRAHLPPRLVVYAAARLELDPFLEARSQSRAPRGQSIVVV